jgi:hypothetical protein
MRLPPTLATWLLAHLASGNDSLVGDLAEAYERGRSRWWYWRQVIAAIATTNDRWLIARGAIVG